MATGFEFFERDLKVATASLEPEAINKAVAAFAKKEVARVVAEGIASPFYDLYVNGREGLAEEAYQAPGAIVYEFVNWPLTIRAAIEELQKRSPRRKTGVFDSSFIVISGGRLVTDFTTIASDAEVIITNATPYVRKAEAGLLGTPKRRLFDGTKSAMNRRFSGVFRFDIRFLDIPGGIEARIPYVLKGEYSRKRAEWLKNPARFSRRFPKRIDQEKGRALTYPSLVINRT